MADEWVAIVNAMPAEWFGRETWPLIAQYCRHSIAARRISQLIDRLEANESQAFNLPEYNQLLGMQEREGRAMVALARSMRLAQATTYDREKKRAATAAPPWESQEG
jgi:hypothetical protein